MAPDSRCLMALDNSYHLLVVMKQKRSTINLSSSAMVPSEVSQYHVGLTEVDSDIT